MYTKKILGLCSACAIVLMVNALPVDPTKLKTGKVYQLISLQAVPGTSFPSPALGRTRRDIIPTYLADQKPENDSGTILAPAEKGDSKRVLNGVNKEVLKAAADTFYPVVYRVRRASDHRRRYEDNDNDYDDDYAGYDRKGSAVGYMDDNDDFPTVVW